MTAFDLEEMIERAAVKAAAHFIESQGQGGPAMASAWVRQRKEQVEELGADKAPWYCYWYDPDGHKPSSP